MLKTKKKKKIHERVEHEKSRRNDSDRSGWNWHEDKERFGVALTAHPRQHQAIPTGSHLHFKQAHLKKQSVRFLTG